MKTAPGHVNRRSDAEIRDDEMKNMTVLNERLSLASALHDSKAGELDMLADAIIESMEEKE